jgi:ABC-type multidrug transport system ATPase subunit
LRVLTAGRTALVIAHRLSTIVDADRIVVMGGGRVIESGTFAELLAAGERVRKDPCKTPVTGALVGVAAPLSASMQEGLFASLWALQVGGKID